MKMVRRLFPIVLLGAFVARCAHATVTECYAFTVEDRSSGEISPSTECAACLEYRLSDDATDDWSPSGGSGP